jgi:hypothetical protein
MGLRNGKYNLWLRQAEAEPCTLRRFGLEEPADDDMP